MSWSLILVMNDFKGLRVWFCFFFVKMRWLFIVWLSGFYLYWLGEMIIVYDLCCYLLDIMRMYIRNLGNILILGCLGLFWSGEGLYV